MSILWNFDKYAKIEELPFDPLCINDDNLIPISDVELLLKAGTPLKATSGVVAPLGQNDTTTCFANEDYHFILTNPQQPKMIKCVTKGYVEQAKVLAAGLESVPDGWAEALAALGLYLVDELGNLPGGSGGGSSGGGVLVVHNVDGTLDKTWQKIHKAFVSGGVIVDLDGKSQNAVISVGIHKGEYTVIVARGAESPISYFASSASGYPAHNA